MSRDVFALYVQCATLKHDRQQCPVRGIISMYYHIRTPIGFVLINEAFLSFCYCFFAVVLGFCLFVCFFHSECSSNANYMATANIPCHSSIQQIIIFTSIRLFLFSIQSKQENKYSIDLQPCQSIFSHSPFI